VKSLKDSAFNVKSRLYLMERLLRHSAWGNWNASLAKDVVTNCDEIWCKVR